VPAPRFPAFVQNLNKFYELCGENDSEAARRLRVAPQQFNEWRKGEHAPSGAARKHIAAILGMDEHLLMYGELKISEINEESYRQFRRRAIDEDTQKLLDEILESGDKEILGHLKRQVALLKDLLDFRRGKK